MRYYVKNPEGQELVCPNLADLQTLYSQSFLDDDDLVRSESSERWIRVGSFAALRGVRESRGEPRRMRLLLAAAVAAALAMLLLVRLVR